jgi:hypothetical protein
MSKMPDQQIFRVYLLYGIFFIGGLLLMAFDRIRGIHRVGRKDIADYRSNQPADARIDPEWKKDYEEAGDQLDKEFPGGFPSPPVKGASGFIRSSDRKEHE